MKVPSSPISPAHRFGLESGDLMGLEMKQLLETMPQVGSVEWIGLRPGRREPVVEVEQAVVGDGGLEGDRFRGKPGSPRMVTLIQKEHLDAVAGILKRKSIGPELVRRNIVVSGINLAALKKHEFQIGEVVLFATGNCPPCSRMEENLGSGGYNAMRGHGGITARVVRGGTIRRGDAVTFQAGSDAASRTSTNDRENSNQSGTP